jgi:hypothetical protein
MLIYVKIVIYVNLILIYVNITDRRTDGRTDGQTHQKYCSEPHKIQHFESVYINISNLMNECSIKCSI